MKTRTNPRIRTWLEQRGRERPKYLRATKMIAIRIIVLGVEELPVDDVDLDPIPECMK